MKVKHEIGNKLQIIMGIAACMKDSIYSEQLEDVALQVNKLLKNCTCDLPIDLNDPRR